MTVRGERPAWPAGEGTGGQEARSGRVDASRAFLRGDDDGRPGAEIRAAGRGHDDGRFAWRGAHFFLDTRRDAQLSWPKFAAPDYCVSLLRAGGVTSEPEIYDSEI